MVLETLRLKYFARDDDGELIETVPEDMYRRVAKAIASAESNFNTPTKTYDVAHWEKTYFNMMADGVFMPGSPCLMNAGTKIKSLAACFLVPMEDSMDGIMSSLKDAAKIFASGGGVGIPLSKLRANGDFISTTKGTSSGPVSFAHMFDAMVDTVKQGGKRRGAMMMTLSVDHPDLLEFIQVKRDRNRLTNMNLSVMLTNEFMQAVQNDTLFLAKDPQTKKDRYFNVPGSPEQSSLAARDILNKIIQGAWSDGEPGVYFIDNAQDQNPFPYEDEYYRLIGPNPCGEATLRAYESCVLGSINLEKFAIKPRVNDTVGRFDFEGFSEAIHNAVRFLDNIVEVSVAPLDQINLATKETRKLGLGVMGLHDALLKMHLPYSLSKSQSTADMVGAIFSTLNLESKKATRNLARERGAYPGYSHSKDAQIYAHADASSRNASVTSIAPTGTISRIVGVSFGIEPATAWQTHHKLVDIEYDEFHPLAKPFLDAGEALPEYFETAEEITPADHLAMQVLIQRYIDQACSKTILLPNDYVMEDLTSLFLKAWESGLKGFTLYRNNSRADQPLSRIEKKKQIQDIVDKATKDGVYDALEHYTSEVALGDDKPVGMFDKDEPIPFFPFIPPMGATNPSEEEAIGPRERTNVVNGPSYKIKTQEGNVYFDVHYNESGEVCEVMLQLGDGFTDTEKALANWAARLASKSLQQGIPYHELVKQGASTEFEHKSRAYPGMVFWYGTNGKKKPYRSIPEVCSDLIIETVNKIANKYDDDEEDVDAEMIEEIVQLMKRDTVLCPQCQAPLAHEGGCKNCHVCGYSAC